MIAWNLTGNNLSVFVNGRSFTMPRTDANCGKVLEAIENDDEAAVLRYVDAKRTISEETEGSISFDGQHLRFEGEIIHNAIVDRLHYLWTNNLPYRALLRFMDRLVTHNPSRRAVQELYRFLEACDLPITNDGHFLAYKRVRDDYTDIHSGTFDNSIGAKPRLRRNEVDEDSNRTCSHGLHVCSAGYLPHFGSWVRNRIIVVKVDPADVVAVPADYNNSKMRVCGYEVIDDVTDEFAEGNRLSANFTEDAIEDDTVDDLLDDHDLDDDADDLENDPAPSVGPSSHATNTTLNEQQVREIKDYLRQGNTPIVRIAEVFNVNESTIRKIRDGLTWAWVQ